MLLFRLTLIGACILGAAASNDSVLRLSLNGARPATSAMAKVGREYRAASMPVPYQSERIRLQLAAPYRIKTADIVDLYTLAPDAWGVSVTFNSVLGSVTRQARLVRVDGDVASEPAELDPVPDGAARPKNSEPLGINTFVRERPPLPRSYQYDIETVQDDGVVSFGYGVVREPEGTPRADDTDQRPAARLLVDLVSNGSRETLVGLALPETPPGAEYDSWRDVTLDFSGHAGKRVTLEFRFESGSEGGPAADSGRWAFSTPLLYSVGRSVADRRTSVILVSLDTLRADHLGLYGYARNTSPFLDAFAEECVVFDRCIAPSSWTAPSHGSVFTGLPASLHGAGGAMHFQLPDRVETLAEVASAHGYRTAAFTEGVAIAGELGFCQGFDQYSDGFGETVRVPDSAKRIFSQGLEFLESSGNGPFFLFLHTYQIHAPYEPPAPYSKQFGQASSTSIIPETTTPENERADAELLYDAEIASVDAALHEFVAALRERGILDQTLLVIFSDHGEEFWEHGSASHGETLYQEVLHVPLLVRPPGPSSPGVRVPALVSLTDVFHTVRPIIGGEATDAESRSLLGSAQAETASPLFVVSRLFELKSKIPSLAIQDETRKYLVHAKGPFSGFGSDIQLDQMLLDSEDIDELLFDLDTDPAERRNVQESQNEDRARLRAALERYVAELTRIAAETPSDEAAMTLPEDARRGLEALGYLN